MKVGLICGSLGAQSANASLLRVAGTKLRADGHGAVMVDGIAAIPAFNPRLVDVAPEGVASFRAQIRQCDALLIAAPEYAAGIAGSTKNALDWLVGDSTLYRKVIGVASAGTTGGLNAIEQLVRTISWQGGWVVTTLSVAAPRTKSDADGNLHDTATVALVGEWAGAVIEASEGSASRRAELLSEVVTRFGIDPARFGDLDDPPINPG